eukprot:COSAG01_NODE_7207_length_3305_cov_2.001248_2_plen_384_part_00
MSPHQLLPLLLLLSSQSSALQDKHILSCGRSSHEDCKDDRCEDDRTPHEVRCCADTKPRSGYQQMNGCEIWAESQVGSARKYRKYTFEEAVSICAEDGARLCTHAEMQKSCTAGTGCSHDADMIWTSSVCEKLLGWAPRRLGPCRLAAGNTSVVGRLRLNVSQAQLPRAPSGGGVPSASFNESVLQWLDGCLEECARWAQRQQQQQQPPPPPQRDRHLAATACEASWGSLPGSRYECYVHHSSQPSVAGGGSHGGSSNTSGGPSAGQQQQQQQQQQLCWVADPITCDNPVAALHGSGDGKYLEAFDPAECPESPACGVPWESDEYLWHDGEDGVRFAVVRGHRLDECSWLCGGWHSLGWIAWSVHWFVWNIGCAQPRWQDDCR